MTTRVFNLSHFLHFETIIIYIYILPRRLDQAPLSIIWFFLQLRNCSLEPRNAHSHCIKLNKTYMIFLNLPSIQQFDFSLPQLITISNQWYSALILLFHRRYNACLFSITDSIIHTITGSYIYRATTEYISIPTKPNA